MGSAFNRAVAPTAVRDSLGTEWLQYARGITCLLADLVHEADAVDCHQMALGLEAIAAMTRAGVHCTAEAHARLSWKEAQRAELG